MAPPVNRFCRSLNRRYCGQTSLADVPGPAQWPGRPGPNDLIQPLCESDASRWGKQDEEAATQVRIGDPQSHRGRRTLGTEQEHRGGGSPSRDFQADLPPPAVVKLVCVTRSATPATGASSPPPRSTRSPSRRRWPTSWRRSSDLRGSDTRSRSPEWRIRSAWRLDNPEMSSTRTTGPCRTCSPVECPWATCRAHLVAWLCCRTASTARRSEIVRSPAWSGAGRRPTTRRGCSRLPLPHDSCCAAEPREADEFLGRVPLAARGSACSAAHGDRSERP